MNPLFKKISYVAVGIFAVIGFVFTAVFVGMYFELFNVRGSSIERNKFFLNNAATSTAAKIQKQSCIDKTKKTCEWNETPEWVVIKNGLEKDTEIISKVSMETGVSKRMIATVVIPEQARFFTANREVFKRYFEPMKILGSMSQFSLGVSGIKEKTALEIEVNLINDKSAFYPGPEFAKLVSYGSSTEDREKELFNRLTDEKNHYYSYLYTALYIKEIETQWKHNGFEITENPEVVATLFNIGFNGSNPNPNPRVGGTSISLGGKTYVYGDLGANFYNSEELGDIFTK
jgi:hypothetical protein